MEEFYSYPHAARERPIHMNLTHFVALLNNMLQNPRYHCPYKFPYQYIIKTCKLNPNSPHLDIICDLYSMVIWQICTSRPDVRLTRQLRSLLESVASATHPHNPRSHHRWFQIDFGFLGAAVFCLESRCFSLMGQRSRNRAHKYLCMLKTSILRSAFMRRDVPATATQCEVLTDFLIDQLLAYIGDRDALHSTYIYALIQDRHIYI